ncbi:MAG: DUF4013 domain-containing protein [Candidatus Nanohaloarchaea archaeon]
MIGELKKTVRESIDEPLQERRLYLKGAALMYLMVFVVPVLTLYGYMMRVIRDASEDRGIPQMEEYVKLTVNGLKMVVVLMPLMLLSFAPYLFLLEGGTIVTNSVLTALALLGYFAVIGYFGIAFMMRYAVERNWRKTYSMETLRLALSVDYLVYVTVFMLLYYLLALIAYILVFISFLTIIGWLIVLPVVYFYLMLWFGVFAGKTYRDLTRN